MYDMYPEWGPARQPFPQHRTSEQQANQYGLDMQDNGGQRPDDN